MRNRFFLTFMAVCATLCAVAQANRIYVDDFEIAPGATVQVPVILANQDTTRGVQFNVTLPQGLNCEEMEMTQYSERKKFILHNSLKDNTCAVMIYQIGMANFEPGNNAIVIMTLRADDTFKGGDLSVWKCRGSTMKTMTIFMDGDTATVSLPKGPQNGFFMQAVPQGD